MRAFLFSDLRGYTEFVERAGDDAAARLLRDYRALVRREVARASGAEVKTEGDSFYVVFDSPSAALDCAVAVQKRAAARNAKDAGTPLRIGMGLHAGETVRFDEQFVGGAVNVAARLASNAGPGEIVASDTMRGLVRTGGGAYEFEDRGELELKGVGERIRAWTIRWRDEGAVAASGPREALAAATLAAPVLPGAPVPGQLVCPVVVGRDAERDRALALVDAAREGRGQTLLIGGEAGVGKSALVRDVTQRALASGFRALYGATLEADSGLPYAPYLAAVRSGFRGLDAERLGRVLAQTAPDLADLFPELARGQRAADPGGAASHRIALAFSGLFRAFAREAPILVVVEDLHWADEASLALLQHLARDLRDSRALIVATYRSDEMHRRHPFLRVLSSLQRERLASEVQLRRLDKEQVRELIRRTFAQQDENVKISEEFRDAIYERSDGNPYFTEELLKALVGSGDVYYTPDGGWGRKPLDELKIPGSIRDAVRERVERLSDDARTSLSMAAVIGLQFDFATLRAARAIGENELEDHLRELIEQQLVNELPGNEERYSFRHALTKEVVYDDLLVRERKRLHRAVAEALADAKATEPATLAHHFLAAGDTERAFPALLEAANRAAAAGAPREAAAQYARALEIGVPEERMAEVIEQQALAYHHFDTAHCIKTASEGLEIYRERSDRRGQSRMLRLIGRSHFYNGRGEDAEKAGQEAIDIVEGEESVELARAVAQQAGLLMARSAMAGSIPLADRAIELAERLDDPWALSHALVTKGSALRTAESPKLIRQGIDVALRHGIVEAAGRGYNNLALALIRLGAPVDERRRVIDDGLAHARRNGVEEAALSYLLSQRMTLEFGAGEWEAVLATADALYSQALVSGWTGVIRARIASAREGPPAALPYLDDLVRRDYPVGSNGAVNKAAQLANAYAEAGKYDEARAYLRQLEASIAPYPRGSQELATPRSDLGGPSLSAVLTAALLTGELQWLEEAEVETNGGDRALAPAGRSMVAAVRALARGDAAAAGVALTESLPLLERIGLAAVTAHLRVTLIRYATERALSLGDEWIPVAAQIRGVAAKTSARYWLSVLEAAGL